MIIVIHMDEIDDDHPAQISELHLVGNFRRGFQIGVQGRIDNAGRVGKTA